jgi:hypothetical protein
MGTWQTIGSIAPIPTAWTIYPLNTTSELFRLTHQWELNHWWKPRGLLAQTWDNSDFLVRPFRIYPRSEQRDLISLPIPLSYKLAGLELRSIAVLLLTPYTTDSAAYTWQLSLEAYELDPNEIPPPGQATDTFDWDDIYSVTGDVWDDIY